MNDCMCQTKRELRLKSIELVPVSKVEDGVLTIDTKVFIVGRGGVVSIDDLDGDMLVQLQHEKQAVRGDSDVMIWVPQWVVIPAAQIRAIFFEGEWPPREQVEIKIDPLHGGIDEATVDDA